MTHFYGTTLGFRVLESARKEVRFQVGTTSFGFNSSYSASPSTYHLAFDIPENQLYNAKAWLEPRVQLLSDRTGDDTFYFENWNSHSLYFYDPAGNIVELIARHTLANATATAFSGTSVVNVSEVGVVVDDVAAQVAELGSLGIAPYRQGVDPEFTPLGDEGGLLIVVRRGRGWFPVGTMPAQPSPVVVVVRVNGQTHTLRFGSLSQPYGCRR